MTDEQKPKITATPFEWRDPATLAPDGLAFYIPDEDVDPINLPPHLASLTDHTGISFDDELGYVDLYWGGYEYSIEYSRINTPEKLYAWLQHLAGKWNTPAWRFLALIDDCGRKFKWSRMT